MKKSEPSSPVGNKREASGMLRCSMTGTPIHDSGDGIYDDGEWISWAWINQYIKQDSCAEPAKSLSGSLLRMIESARAYEEETGRASDLWGEIGERFAAEQYGLTLHKRSSQQGSDARLDDEYVEVKTITWQKRKSRITVKRAGNFSRLVLVRVHANYALEAIMVARSELQRGEGKSATLSWKTALGAQGARWIAQTGALDPGTAVSGPAKNI